MTYTASKKPADIAAEERVVHLSWIRFLLDRFTSAKFQSGDYIKFYVKFYQIAHEHMDLIKWVLLEVSSEVAPSLILGSF